MFEFLTEKFSHIIAKIRGSLSSADVERMTGQVEEALFEADVPRSVITDFVNIMRTELTGMKLRSGVAVREQIAKGVYDILVRFLGGNAVPASFATNTSIMVMGLQGSGKTTTIAKIASFVKKQDQQKNGARTKSRILLSSLDFQRPAAIEQLEILAKRVECSFYRPTNTNILSAAHEVKEYARKGRYDLFILDTAGRLQIDKELMEELVAVHAIIKPDKRFLVLDAMTGQQSLSVAQEFEKQIGFEGAILTKMDSGTRGGAAFAFRYALKKPIIFVGTGEGINDFARFHPDRMAEKLLGMGDLRSLAERAEEVISTKERQRLQEQVRSGELTLETVVEQLNAIESLGSLSQISQYIPGARMNPGEIAEKQKELCQFRAIINSMTKKERLDPYLLDTSRKRRIALGAGVRPESIDELLKHFKQMQQYAKLFKRMGGPFGMSQPRQ